MNDLDALLNDMDREISKVERDERATEQALAEVSMALDGKKYIDLLKRYCFLKGRKDAFAGVDVLITTEYMS